MKGAIFFSGKYGSTEQYSKWINEATGLPVFDIQDARADPSQYDFLVLGSSILYFKLTNRKWVKENLHLLTDRAKILFSVSGAGPSKKLNRWVANSLPRELLSQMEHVALRGKLDHSKVSWGVKIILWVGSLFNPSSDARKDERYGFDYMDKATIEPIVRLVEQFQAREVAESDPVNVPHLNPVTMANRLKIVAICGSPHRGNTYDVLKVLEQSNPEVDFKLLMLSELELKDCFGCYSCINNGEDTCPLKDDRDVIIEAMQEADGTIFASPTYARMVSALMKKFVERTSFLAHRPPFFGKYAMALATCAGFGADLTCKYLRENFTQCGFRFVPSVELMVAAKSESETNHNRTKAIAGYEKLISAIQAQEEVKPSFNQLVYFNIFKSISEMNKVKGWADHAFYQDKNDFYYDTEIPLWKSKLAKWIAGREVKKMRTQ